MADYKLVPTAGSTGKQIVSGKREAMRIAREIADREIAPVIVTPQGKEFPIAHVLPPTRRVAVAAWEREGTIKGAARATGLSVPTVRKYVRAHQWAELKGNA